MVCYEAMSILESADDVRSCRCVVAVEVDCVCLDHGGSAGRFVYCRRCVGVYGTSTVWIGADTGKSR